MSARLVIVELLAADARQIANWACADVVSNQSVNTFHVVGQQRRADVGK